MSNKKLPDEFLNAISGGTLPTGWEQMADQMAPSLREQYPDITYDEACTMLASYISDPADQELIKDYMKKFF